MSGGYLMKESPNPVSCAGKWIRLTEANWRTALEWYRRCAELAGELSGPERDRYSAALISNLRRSSEDFAPRAGPISGPLKKDIASIADYLLYPQGMLSLEPKIVHEPHEELIGQARQDNVRQGLSEVLDYLFVAGLLSILLTVVLFCVMCCYCCRYKAIRDVEKQEIELMLESRFSCNKPGQNKGDGGRSRSCLEDTDDEILVKMTTSKSVGMH